jgi:hypothetical protein
MVIYFVLVDIVNTIAKSLGRLPPAASYCNNIAPDAT